MFRRAPATVLSSDTGGRRKVTALQPLERGRDDVAKMRREGAQDTGEVVGSPVTSHVRLAEPDAA